MIHARESGAILLKNTMAYDPNQAVNFRLAINNAVEFAKKQGPQLMTQVYIDDEKMLCYSFQLFPSSDAVVRHWQISDPNIAEVIKHCTIRSMEVYGSPSESVRNGIISSAGEALVSFTPELTGFIRLG